MDPNLTRIYPLCPLEAPDVVPPRAPLGPLGLCVKARNRDSIIKSSQAVWLLLQETRGKHGSPAAIQAFAGPQQSGLPTW